jgi:murein DD-endopeptidase MepM/ murein hydrolase activator NlpD
LCLLLALGMPGRALASLDAAGAEGAVKAPAVENDVLRRNLQARLEFEQLNLRLSGVAAFQGAPSCFIQYPAAGGRQMIYRVGDVIDGFQVAMIENNSVRLERDGIPFWLTMGDGEENGDTGVEAETPETAVAQEDEALDTGAAQEIQVALKTAPEGLKERTARFKSSKLIEDASTVVAAESKSSQRRMVAASGMFVTPMRGKITSTFGYRRDPMGGGRRYHRGLDIAASPGTEVCAAAAGEVTRVRYSGTYGRYVMIRHANGYETLYGHLSKALVSVGDKVAQGETIGREGSTGRSTGPHLHFEVHKNGVALNPQSYVRVRR